jgi:hypothetical protein
MYYENENIHRLDRHRIRLSTFFHVIVLCNNLNNQRDIHVSNAIDEQQIRMTISTTQCSN